jgi:hypothetical protein
MHMFCQANKLQSEGPGVLQDDKTLELIPQLVLRTLVA